MSLQEEAEVIVCELLIKQLKTLKVARGKKNKA
jgi:hypothetical protein